MPPKRVRTVSGSCWPCKDRRVICDLTQPTCKKCIAAGLVCEFGKVRLRWGNGVASRGRLAGKNVPTSPAKIPPTPATSLSVQDLMLYFQHEVLPRFSLSSEQPQIDIAGLSQDAVVCRLMSVVANAHHLFRRPSGHNDNSLKSRDRSMAIQVFRSHLAAGSPGQTMFMSNVLLCILDGIIEPCDEGAAGDSHLRGGKAIIERWNCLDELFLVKDGVQSVMLSVFVTMDLTHSILSCEPPYFSHHIWSRFANCQCWWGELSDGDPLLEVMAILSQLSSLGHDVQTSGTIVPISDLLSFQMALERTDRVPLGNNEETLSSNSFAPDPSWRRFCSAFRLAALIYMYRALCNLEVGHQLVQQATSEGINVICGEPLPGKLRHCLLFPALIIGSHCVDPTHRSLIKQSLMASASYLSFGSIIITVEFLEKIWAKNEDFAWMQAFSQLSKCTFLF